MLGILKWNVIGVIFRPILIWLDSIAFGLVDDIYDIITVLASKELFSSAAINDIMKNTYILVSILAFFRIAILLVNTMINPDKLNDKESGLVQILRNLVLVFVFLVIVPIAFSTLREVQDKVVKGNYINKIFSGEGDISGKKPGKIMQKIAVSALIKPNKRLYETVTGNPEKTMEPKSECTGTCKDAIEAWDTMMNIEDKGVKWATLSRYISTSVEIEDKNSNKETIYVYDYTAFVPIAVGLAMTYIMISLVLDIALRAVELAVLEVLAPLFIATYVDPKWAKSGPFHNWLTQVGKTYANLFIKLAIIAIMIMLLELVDDINGNAFLNIFIILGILIFVKKAGEWFAKLLGVSSDSTGLGGFKKKLGQAALVGGALTKGMNAAAGAGIGAAQTIHNANKNRRAQKKQARNELGYKRGFSKKAKAAQDKLLAANGYNNQTYAERQKALRKIKKDAYRAKNVGGLKNNLAQTGAAFVAGAVQGGQAGLKADGMKGIFTGSINAANQFATGVGMKGTDSLLKRGSTWVKGLPGKVSDAWGTSTERFEARDKIAKDKQVLEWTNGKCTSGTEKGQLINGQGAFNKFVSNNGIGTDKQISNFNDFLAAQYATNQGFDLSKISRKEVVKKDSSGNPIKDSNGNIVKELQYSFKDSSGIDIKINAPELEKNLGGIVDPSSSAMTTYEKMWNSYQSSCLNNYTQNQQAYAQEAATYQQAYAQSNASMQQAKDMASTLTPTLTAALGKLAVSIDDSTMTKFSDTIKENLNEIERLKKKDPPVSDDKLRRLNDAESSLNELKQKLAIKEEFDKQVAESQKTLNTIRSAQNQLQAIYDGISGDTSAEKAQNISIKEKKLSDTLENFKNKEDK